MHCIKNFKLMISVTQEAGGKLVHTQKGNISMSKHFTKNNKKTMKMKMRKKLENIQFQYFSNFYVLNNQNSMY